MEWWIWVLVGFGFLILEALTAGTLVVGFFGFGAFAVGLLVLLGYGGAAWVQFLLFSVLSLGALAAFRQPILRRMRGEEGLDDVDSLAGEEGTALTVLPAGGSGRVELRGTVWSARNTSAESIPAGTRIMVEKVRGLTLDVGPAA